MPKGICANLDKAHIAPLEHFAGHRWAGFGMVEKGFPVGDRGISLSSL